MYQSRIIHIRLYTLDERLEFLQNIQIILLSIQLKYYQNEDYKVQCIVYIDNTL
jgi:hypothetical protein